MKYNFYFVDVNECEGINPCVHGNCTNTVGDYSCSCDSGWTGKNCDEGTQEFFQIILLFITFELAQVSFWDTVMSVVCLTCGRPRRR